MKGFFLILRTAFKLFVNREKYVYFYGAKGEKLDTQTMDALIAAYPTFYSRYSPEQLAEYKRLSWGKIGLDCSGFVTAVSGIYGSSAMIWEKCTTRTTVAEGKAGSFLFKKGDGMNHCGIDIGYGYCMHCPGMGRTIEIAKIQSVGFTMSGELPGYDYAKASNF